MSDDLDTVIADLVILGIQPETSSSDDRQVVESLKSPPYDDLSVDELVRQLEAIKERIFRLLAVFAVSLSRECSAELESWRSKFICMAETLRKKDPERLNVIVEGHEKLLLTKLKSSSKPTIPIAVQQNEQLRWWIRQLPKRPPQRKITYSDGLDQFV